ncbi:MAG TPA: retroviral-like aspartic protease family protein [Stellaceae bacterium]|nr:retroviral-like aspartic protease family protein [Stellaceae bacterium]
MRRGFIAAAALAAALAALMTPAIATDAGPAPCRIERQAQLQLIGDPSQMVVAAAIDGSPVAMIVDTGAQWTAVTPQTVKRLHMPPDSWNGGLHRGVGSFSNSINAVARSVEIGGIRLEGRSLSVIPLAFGVDVGLPFAGLLGADFLYRFDLDIDLPHRTLTLYRNGGCRTGAPPWDVAAVAIPLVRSAPNRLTLPVSVDGHPFHAILDTGAGGSLITRPNALRAGVSAETLEHDPVILGRGAGPQEFAARTHIFAEIRIGPERLRNFAMTVGGTTLGGGDMLLGLDYLRSRRVWLSYATRQMFVAAPARGG